MIRINLLKSVRMAEQGKTPPVVVQAPVVQPQNTTPLGRLMAEVIRARNASQSALEQLRSGRVPSNEESLRELKRRRQEVQLRRQDLLRALATHQGA